MIEKITQNFGKVAKNMSAKAEIESLILKPGNTKRGSITVPLTSCFTGLDSAIWQLTFFCFYLQNRLIQTSQTGGQQYSDASPFSIPC